MGNGSIVHVGKRFDDIFQVFSSLIDIKYILFNHVVKEGSSIYVLENQVDALVIFEKAVELDYVRVLEAAVESDLCLELLDHFVLSNSGLDYFFEGENGSSLYVPAQVDLPELPLPQLLRQVESVNDV